MTKKAKRQIEIVRPAQEQMLDRLTDAVLKRLEDREANRPATDEELSESVLLHPWMLPRHVSLAIRNLLPTTHWQKWTDVYDEFGCWKCERKDTMHASLGLCTGCYGMLSSRVKSAIVKRVEGQKGRPRPSQMRASLTQGEDSAKAILSAIVPSKKRS